MEHKWPQRCEELSGTRFKWLHYMVLRYSGKDWDWYKLSSNPSITWDFVQANQQLPWNWRGLSENPSITGEFVQANPDKDWNYMFLSDNPSITWEFVQANPDDMWDWQWLSSHPSIGCEIVQEESPRDTRLVGIRDRKSVV